MTRAEELKDIMQAVINGHYSEDDFNKFKGDYGWADWMSEYTESEDGPVTESESREIDKILLEGFKMAFNPETVKVWLG